MIWGNARTEVNRETRMVTLRDLKLVRSNFPALDDNGASYLAQLGQQLPAASKTIALDRIEASLAASGAAQIDGAAGEEHGAGDPRQLRARAPDPDRRPAGRAQAGGSAASSA